jgi:segregation and condensation protein B
MDNMKAIIEALILASEAPLGLEKICAVLPELEKGEARKILEELIAEYNERAGGICLQEVAGGFQFRTRAEWSQWIKKLKGTKPPSLSASALETLAIVAYRQPLVKSEIESIRGVDAGHALKVLLEKKLLRIVGRKDVPGKPIIYGTTKKFLEVFNLKDLSELPTLRELKELNEPAENLVPVEADEEAETDDLSKPDAARQMETESYSDADTEVKTESHEDMNVDAETREESADDDAEIIAREKKDLETNNDADTESKKETPDDGSLNTEEKTETEADAGVDKPTDEISG